MSTFPIEIAGLACIVHYTAKVTCEAQRATGPTYSCGGEPATAMEFEVTVTELVADTPNPCPPLELPLWLRSALEALIQEDDGVYEEVAEDHEAEKHGDPDEAYERRWDDPPPRGWDD